MENKKIEDMAQFLKVLAHPVRLMILETLLKKTKCVSDIKDLLNVPQSNMSQHLNLLKLYGIIDCEQKGHMKCYYLKNMEMIKEFLHLFNKYKLS